jgi:uncharacterized protein (TIGR03382 family)
MGWQPGIASHGSPPRCIALTNQMNNATAAWFIVLTLPQSRRDTVNHPRLAVLAALAACTIAASAPADVTFDFSLSSGGFTSAFSPTWVYGGAYPAPGGAAWSTPGSSSSTANSLTSLVMTVASDGFITGSITHRYNFELGFDGGLINYQRNDEAIHVIPASLMGDNPATGSADRFTGTSAGWLAPAYITTTFTLGNSYVGAVSFEAGDEIIFQFNAGWDSSISYPSPNWQIGSLSLTNIVPAPGTASLLGLSMVVVSRRRRA